MYLWRPSPNIQCIKPIPMRKLILLSMLLIASTIVLHAQETYDNHTKILNDKMVGVKHINMDVEVYRIIDAKTGKNNFVFEFYVKHGAELIPHKFFLEADANAYNIASYSWDSDRSLTMHIRHTDRTETKTFRLIAENAGTTTVEWLK